MRWIRFIALMLLLALLTGCMARPALSPATTQPVLTATVTPTQTTTPAPTLMQEMPSPTSQALHSGGTAVVQAEEFISLRLTDSTQAQRICKLPTGSLVRILQLHTVFARVETPDGQRGYVLRDYLRPCEEEISVPEMQPGPYTVICRDYVTLRAQGNFDAEELTRLEPGSAVELKQVNATHAQVCAIESQLTGWVAREYLTPGAVLPQQTQSLSPAPETGTAASDQTFTVRCRRYLTLRDAPNSSAQALLTLPNGTKVTDLDERSGPYCRVSADGVKGWVLSGYLETAPLPETEIVKITENYSYDQMLADCKSLAKRYGDYVQLSSIGKSEQGRTLAALIVGDEDAPHHILLQAAMHGREHMTTLLLMVQTEMLLLNEEIPEDVCLHILPMTNPDGVTISQTQQMTEELRAIYRAEGSTLDEKDYLRLWKANANGVDLNRNFDADHRMGMRANQPAAKLYPGKTPENQDESRALANYVRKNNFDITVSYHAYGSVIYWQYGNNTAANDTSHTLAEMLSTQTGYTLKGDSGTEGGGFKDWALDVMGIPSVTIEIGTRSCPLPLDEFSDIWLRNRNVLPALMDYVRR